MPLGSLQAGFAARSDGVPTTTRFCAVLQCTAGQRAGFLALYTAILLASGLTVEGSSTIILLQGTGPWYGAAAPQCPTQAQAPILVAQEHAPFYSNRGLARTKDQVMECVLVT